MVIEVKGLGKIEADKDVLYEIALSFRDSALLNNSQNRTPMAITQMNIFETIHNALADSGYYKTSYYNIK